MINLGRIVHSRNFAQRNPFIVHRKTGSFDRGRWTANPDASLPMRGTIVPAEATDLDQVPEGDRVKGVIMILTTQPIYVTRAQGTSDEIEWLGDRFRVFSVEPWIEFGFYKALGIRMGGN